MTSSRSIATTSSGMRSSRRSNGIGKGDLGTGGVGIILGQLLDHFLMHILHTPGGTGPVLLPPLLIGLKNIAEANYVFWRSQANRNRLIENTKLLIDKASIEKDNELLRRVALVTLQLELFEQKALGCSFSILEKSYISALERLEIVVVDRKTLTATT